MTYYLLPRSNFLSQKYIDCIISDDIPGPVVSNSLSNYLYEIKEELESQEKDWDIYKKYTNPYEYIHTVIPQRKKCVSKYKPLSRSYFKMIEIIQLFDLHYDSKPVRSFHLAEGPGGFIEAFSGSRKSPQDCYVGMTILDDNNDPNIPAWKKTENFLRQNKNVYIEKGATGTGNILAIENLEYCRDKYASSMDLITADGGFDFSLDFNQQEIIISRLLYAQIAFAILLQRRGGCFILKIFDAFMQHSIDLLYILSSFYEKTYIIKPQTSRYANSEKYVVCKNFLFSSTESQYPILHRTFEKMMASPDKYIQRFMTIPIPISFVTRLEEYNAIFGQQQIENIHYTISLIKNKNRQDKVENLVKTNVQKCIAWCIKYNIPFYTLTNNVNQRSSAPNIFTLVPETELDRAEFMGSYGSTNVPQRLESSLENNIDEAII